MDQAEQYRKNAADSLMLSREANTRASQDYWRTMAEFWFRLAQHVEKTEAVAVPEIWADQEGKADKETAN